MQRPSYLERESPLDALCRHFNVQPTATDSANVGPTFDMHVVRDAHMPTHVLAVTQADQTTPAPPLMLPIDASLFKQGFRAKLDFPLPDPGSTAPVPRLLGDSQTMAVALPVIAVRVPHVTSLPLLLLFSMKLETQLNYLAWSLLPVKVVEEFPNAAEMSLILSRNRDDRFERTYRHNQGIWKNILALGLTDARILEVCQNAWNITAEARRIRQRAARQQES